jgi:hypothetical protein
MDISFSSRQRLIKEAVREFMVGGCDPARTLKPTRKKEIVREDYN